MEQEQVFNFLDEKEGLEGFTAGEISHLEDVKKVMKFADYLFYILFLMLSLILTYNRKDKKFTLRLLKFGGIGTIVFVLLILIFTLVSFNFSFTVFHKIFFPQGNWTFPFDSKLIQTFPLEFFIEVSRNMFVLSLVLGVLIVGIGRKVMRK